MKYIRALQADELEILTELYTYNDVNEMIKDNSVKIKSGIIDIFCLYENSVLIGELRVMYENEDKRFAVKDRRVYLYAFRIHKDFRGKGLGKYLLSNVINKLWKNGYTEFTVGVEDDNKKAEYIYKSFGFDKLIARIQEEYQGDKYEYNLYLKG